MKTMVLALAARIDESEFARWWRAIGAMIDYAIPAVLFVVVLVSLAAVAFGFTD